MKAAVISQLAGPASVTVQDVAEPSAGGQVLIEVRAAGVCFPDVLQTRGLYQFAPPVPFVPGSEVSGIVLAAPADSGFAAGDRVAAFSVLGGFAERVAVPLGQVFALPDGVGFDEAAALPMNYLTCDFALRVRAGMAPGETVLVHGAAGGIGTAAIQLARAGGARVIAVVSSADKDAVARSAGAHEVIPVSGFKDAARELTQGRGVDIIVDPVGGDRFTDSLRALAPLGRLLVIGFTEGSIPEVKVNRLLLGNLSVVGVGWGALWTQRPGFLQEQWAAIAPLVASRAIRPVVGATYPLAEVGAALSAIDERSAVGKLIVHPGN